MPHTEDWAKRLLGKLPADPEELFERASYHDPTFLRLWLDWLDGVIFDDPRKGLRWAIVAPALAKLAGRGRPANERRDGVIRARVVLASAYRRTSQHSAAAAEYREAQEVADSGTVSTESLVLLKQNRSILLACQGLVFEALEMLDDVLELQGPELFVARLDTMVRRGYMLNELAEVADSKRVARELAARAAAVAEEVLAAVDPGESPLAERIHYCAVHNLANALRRLRVADTWRALDYIREARSLLKGQRSGMARAGLDWVESLAWNRLGMHARAERSFKVARGRFVALRAPWEIALVSLDLCVLHQEHGEWAELEILAADTCHRFRVLSGNTQAVAALSLCVSAARARLALSATADEEIIAQAQRKSAAALDAARELVVVKIAQS